jgi:hypothetical protein
LNDAPHGARRRLDPAGATRAQRRSDAVVAQYLRELSHESREAARGRRPHGDEHITRPHEA